MALVDLHVRRIREQHCRGRNLESVLYAVDDSAIKLACPSVCKKEGVTDGLVNALAVIEIGGVVTYLWCTETQAAISVLS